MTDSRTSDSLLPSLVKQSPADVVRTVGRSGWKYTDAIYHRRWLARAMKKILVDTNGCWRWQGFKGKTGYAQIPYRGQALNGHRTMYRVHYGVNLETEQYVLHRCDVRDCVNPEHMWIGTAKDNNNDCADKGRHFEGTKTYCDHGHPLFGDNLRVAKQHPPKTGIRRVCRACERARLLTPEYKAKANERQRRRRRAIALARRMGAGL